MNYDGRFWRALLSHPATWLATLTVVGLEWSFMTWFQPNLLIAGLSLGLGFLLLILWPTIFLKSDAFADAYFGSAKVEIDRNQARISALQSELREIGSVQGAEQLEKLQEKFESLESVLKRRLGTGELTYARYLSTAHRVYLAAVDNLNEVAVSLRSVSAVDTGYIQRRLQELEEGSRTHEERQRGAEPLEERQRLLEKQLTKVASLLADNETAMTVLTNTATALADTKTEAGHAGVDSATAIRDLEALASRVGKYAVASTD